MTDIPTSAQIPKSLVEHEHQAVTGVLWKEFEGTSTAGPTDIELH